jgi:restriction endonuclease Mrr
MLPKYIDINLPLLKEIVRCGDRINVSDKYNGKTIYQSLSEFFKLSQEDLDAETKDGRNKWENMVQWARNDLVKLGYLSSSETGVWAVTEDGKAVSALDQETYKNLVSLLRRKE